MQHSVDIHERVALLLSLDGVVHVAERVVF
jgi:hypothetical protein